MLENIILIFYERRKPTCWTEASLWDSSWSLVPCCSFFEALENMNILCPWAIISNLPYPAGTRSRPSRHSWCGWWAGPGRSCSPCWSPPPSSPCPQYQSACWLLLMSANKIMLVINVVTIQSLLHPQSLISLLQDGLLVFLHLHLEVLLNLHQLLQDASVGRILLGQSLLQTVHSPSNSRVRADAPAASQPTPIVKIAEAIVIPSVQTISRHRLPDKDIYG